MAETQAQTSRDTKPAGATASAKGAAVMGAAGSPTGPNETEDGIIKSPPPQGPGPDQIGLVGGDPGEPLASTPPLEESAAAPQKTAKK